MPWKARTLAPLERQNDELKLVVVRLRYELTSARQAVGRLRYLVRERSERVDQLTARVDQLRDQNRRLDQEADRLVEMIRLSP
jgi:hypothetical protein